MKHLVQTVALVAALSCASAQATPVDGQIDTSFATAGELTLNFNAPGTTQDSFITALQRSDGKIMLVGMAENGNSYDGILAIARLLPNGTLDTDFGANGLLTVNPRPSVSEGFSGAAIDSSNRILVVGSELNVAANQRQALVCRLFGTGAIDTSYGTDGDGCVTVLYPNSSYAGFNAAAVQGDGKLVAVGQNMLTNNNSRGAFARLDTDGSLDDTFGNADGINGFPCTSTAGCVMNNVAVAPSGRIVAVGYVIGTSNNDFQVLALNDVGRLDTSFNSNGEAAVAFDLGTAKNDEAQAIALGRDGRIAVGGVAQAQTSPELLGEAALVEFAADGTLNYKKTFYLGATDGTYSGIGALAYQQDGKLLAAGATLSNGSFNFRTAISRLLVDGSVDTDYGNGNGQLVDYGLTASPDSSATAIVLQGTVPLLAGTTFDDSTNDHSVFAATRLTSDLIFATGFE